MIHFKQDIGGELFDQIGLYGCIERYDHCSNA